MYDRRVAGNTLHFGHAGMLIQNSFVMYDKGTDSWWIQANGTAYEGAYKGQRLAFLPSTLTTWALWKRRFPHTLVVNSRGRDGFMSRYDGATSTANLGISLVLRFQAKLYPFTALAKTKLIHDTFLGVPVLLAFSPETHTVTAWDRRLGGKLLRFAPAPQGSQSAELQARELETGSVFSLLSGKALSGPLRGQQMEELAQNPILIDRFRVFYPGAPVYGEGKR